MPDTFISNTPKAVSIYYATLGCKVNQCETENLRQRLSADGFIATDDIKSADICVVNSCTVTAQADKKCRQLLHRIKRVNPDCKIVLTGCLPQVNACKADELYRSGLCDVITGNTSISVTVDAVKALAFTGAKAINITPHLPDESFELFENGEFESKTRAYLKIQDGCNQFCTYCIIPYARGRVRSKPLDAVKREAERLAECGHLEIVLTGINLCCYGNDLDGDIRLADAVEAVCSAHGIERVRLGSIEPEMISDDDIKRLASQEKLCPQFHLSLQSGCDKTLKAMNRKYSSAEYALLVEKLRSAFPDCAITTDVMVGFPGEMQEDFESSLEFVKSIGFAKVHIFPYSVRPGTIAEKMPCQISEDEKHIRAEKMRRVCEESERTFLEKMVGKRVKVLFEKENCTRFHGGYCGNYTHIKIIRKNPQKSLRRMSFYVIIKSAENGFCLGEICDD